MPIEVHVLGTSSARPAQGRSVSGSIVETGDGIFVIDCGEGFQNRLVTHRSALKKSEGRKIKVGKIAGILLTHGHLDHTWGVLPWLQTMALDGRKEKLYVIGPTTTQVIDVLLHIQWQSWRHQPQLSVDVRLQHLHVPAKKSLRE